MYWRALVPDGTWRERIIYPFRYLASDGFWEMIKDGAPIADADLGHPTSIGQLAARIDYGRFVPALWPLLQDRVARDALRRTLLDTYFAGAAQISDAVAVDPLAAEAERLIEEARQVRFRKQPEPKLIRESDIAYLRHSLFPRVVTGLYDHACAVCRLGVRDDGGRTLVDAAHILPFARFGNDDPRNGLALCKNHHWGFDSGWFTIAPDYTVIASPAVRGITALVSPGTSILLPANSDLAPTLEALEWHRRNIFQD